MQGQVCVSDYPETTARLGDGLRQEEEEGGTREEEGGEWGEG